jgi:trehalose 6-phosphate synthase
MGLSLRFVLPLFIALGVLTLSSMNLVDRFVHKWSIRELDARADFLAGVLANEVENADHDTDLMKSRQDLTLLFNRAVDHEKIGALGFCDEHGVLLAASSAYPKAMGCNPTHVSARKPISQYITLRSVPNSNNALAIVLDGSYLSGRYEEIRRTVFLFFAIIGIITSVITVVIAQLSWRGWVSSLRMLLLKRDFISRRRLRLVNPQIRPIARDLRAFVNQLQREIGVRDEAAINWTPTALREILQRDLAGEEVLVVSNREPYIHVRKNEKIEVQFPASGVVSALEPIMRACSGTWIAHGSGNADRVTVDKHDRVAVPPDHPSYRLRRVWLTPEEEQGYYYGFANEGLWPLCHVAHTRPIFRTEDWEYYKAVNQKFADAVISEAKTRNPVILVQDYHFALLPRILRERMPRATVILFWHIPWPNAESFGICPWREEILNGMLGASILGFHTRFHCNNFIDSVDRFREARIDRETSTISSGGHLTAVRTYPISIEWPPRWLEGQPSIREARRLLHEEFRIRNNVSVGIGVDRMDYTKGILERFRSVERLLEIYPEWREKFSFVQIASPSRSSIPQYKDFDKRVREETDRINLRYGTASYRPIILRAEHHKPFDVYRHFRAAEICVVSSLHDGMNLVAKEFVAARDDEQGVLVLSEFTGAARELPEALIVNPYDIDQCAAALRVALTMEPAEQQARMRSMRNFEREFNVYRWAGRMLLDAARMRQKNKFQDRFRNSA